MGLNAVKEKRSFDQNRRRNKEVDFDVLPGLQSGEHVNLRKKWT